MNELLLLTHRIPYPPDKGDKIRSYHLLRSLARRYDVSLGTFVDDERDWAHVGEVRKLCKDAHFAKLDRRRATLKSLTGLLTGQPLTLPFYRDAGLAAWVGRRLADGVRKVVVFSSSMAQYVADARASDCRRLIDFCDVDSDKWRQYAASARWPRSFVYRREADRLLAYERSIAASFDASVFVSSIEAQLFRSLAPESAARVHTVANGVDTDYFDPAHEAAAPLPAGARVVVFTGAMDYWANVDAVCWFAREVWPLVLQREPSALFCIVGSNPTAEVKALESSPRIVVTGRVPDVRPYLQQAGVSVAPLRIARGVQNKVLEALAMARPVVATRNALQGIERDPPGVAIADDAASFAGAVCSLLASAERSELGRQGRAFVRANFAWDANLERLLRLVEGETNQGAAPLREREAAVQCL